MSDNESEPNFQDGTNAVPNGQLGGQPLIDPAGQVTQPNAFRQADADPATQLPPAATQPQPIFANATEAPTRREPRRWRASSVMIVTAVGALVLASAATGIAATARVVSLDNQASASTSGNSSTGGGTATLIPRQGTGSGSGSAGTGNSFGRASSATNTTAASAKQSVGVVLIETVLKYQSAEAAGTGIILTSNGEILTNNHVIDGATSIKVTIASTGKTYVADVVGTDPTSDVAVLKLEGASGLTAATTNRSSSAAKVADEITAVGNAGGTGSLSAAKGAITALNQTITASGESGSNPETLNGLIETNADVVAGDSGGPLYNASGAVIGIDTAASSGTSAVTGYAIPIATALDIAKQIETGIGTSSITIGLPPFLGVEVAASASGSSSGTGTDGSGTGASNPNDPSSQGTGAANGTVAGVSVQGVVDGTPAATIGLAAGDTITAVDSTAVTTPTQLTQLLGTHKIGDTVIIHWTDSTGAAQSASVVLIAGAAN